MFKTFTPSNPSTFYVLQQRTSPLHSWATNANRSAVITLLCTLTSRSPIIPSQRTPIDTWHMTLNTHTYTVTDSEVCIWRAFWSGWDRVYFLAERLTSRLWVLAAWLGVSFESPGSSEVLSAQVYKHTQTRTCKYTDVNTRTHWHTLNTNVQYS